MSTWKLIKADLYRYSGKSDIATFVFHFFYNKSFAYNFYYRLSNHNLLFVSFLAKARLKFLIWSTGIDIPPKVKIGKGFYIGHPQSVVINPTCIIGENCNISQFVTIGSNNGKAATIGNEVYIGPNVCIIENVVIGNRVTIGAGSVVTKDIPDDATVVGVPARVIHYNNSARFIKNIAII